MNRVSDRGKKIKCMWTSSICNNLQGEKGRNRGDKGAARAARRRQGAGLPPVADGWRFLLPPSPPAVGPFGRSTVRAHDVALCFLPVKRDDAALGQAGIGPRLAELPPETPDKCALRNSYVVAHI